MSTAILRRDDANLKVAITDEAKLAKAHALEISGLIGRVSTAEENAAAVNAQQHITAVIRLSEQSRVEAKAPVLAFGRAIDEAVKLHVEALKDEELRLSRIIGDYQQLELAKARAAEQVRLAEQRKLEDERRRAEQDALEKSRAEQRRLDAEAAEIARKERDARNAQESARLEAERLELDRQRKLAEAKSHDELDRINDDHASRVAALPVAAPPRAQGQVITEDWDITVQNIQDLARFHANCVKITPLIGEIKSLLKMGGTVRGVLAKPIVKASVRATKQPTAIDV